MTSKTLRYEVMRRDAFTCRYCGRSAPDVKLHVDHVLPVALGGRDDASNLTTSCADCNQGKGSTPPDAAIVQDVHKDSERQRQAIRAAQDAAAQAEASMKMLLAAFEEDWSRWLCRDEPVPRPDDWAQTVRQFTALGLQPFELEDAIAVAMHSKATPRTTWRYFCGVCWNKVRDLQEATDRIMSQTGNPF